MVKHVRAALAELVQVFLADQDGTRVAQASDDRCVVIRYVVCKDPRAERSFNAARAQLVLDAKWKPVQRPAIPAAAYLGFGFARPGQRRLRAYGDIGTQHWIVAFDARQRALHELDRREFAAADQASLLRSGQINEFRIFHRGSRRFNPPTLA